MGSERIEGLAMRKGFLHQGGFAADASYSRETCVQRRTSEAEPKLLAAGVAWRLGVYETSFARERVFRLTVVFSGNLETYPIVQEILSPISAIERFML